MNKRRKIRKQKPQQHKKGFLPKQLKRTPKPSYFKDSEGNVLGSIDLVFPIIRRSSHGVTECVGTAFLIHPVGGFITAKHCLERESGYDGEYFGIQTIRRKYQVIRKIVYYEAHQKGDIAVGMLSGELRDKATDQIVYLTTFAIAAVPPKIGEDVYILGYPRMRISSKKMGTFPCDRYDGTILEHLPEGTAKIKSECFVTNINIKCGSSGGPVIRDFKVIGVCSSSFDNDGTVEPISFITPIHLVYDLELKDSSGGVSTVKQMMHDGYIPKAQ